MSVEYKYSPVEGTVTIDNKLEIDEEKSNGKSTSEIADMTVERDISDAISNGKSFLYIAACIVNLAALTCGITFGWTSPVLPKLESNATTPFIQSITTVESAWIGSLLALGAAIGPFAAGISADKIGRKKTLLIAGVPFVISFAGFAWLKHVSIFYILRFASGLSVGYIFTVLPMYVAEISDDSVRGSLGSFMQLFVTLGLLFSYVIGPYVSIMIFNVICLIPAILFLVLFFILIPESPYYLVAENKEEEGTKALTKFRSNSDVKTELESIKQIIQEAKANKGSFLDLFKSKVYIKAMMLSVGLVFFQQFSGINVVIFYTYEVTGGSMRADIATIMVGAMQVVFSCIAPLAVERKGKRFLLLTSALGMTLSLGGLGYYFRMKDVGSSTDSLAWLPLLSLVIYNATYCSGFGPLPWAIMGELFPANVKSAASTLTASICWFLGFLITKYFSIVVGLVGKGISFYIFSFCCILAAVFVYKLVPETTGKSLQEIQDILEGKSSTPNVKSKNVADDS